MNKESIEEKVERLEYYINLMRDYTLDPETFEFWDWVISKKLNEEEARNIIDITKEFNDKYRNKEEIKFEEYLMKVKEILNWENREEYIEPINEFFIKNMLNSLKNLMFKETIDYLLKQME